MRVTASCQIFEFLHLFSEDIKTGRFFSRLVQNASGGFLSDLWISAPFQWAHTKTGRFFSRLVQNASDGLLSHLWISPPFQWAHEKGDDLVVDWCRIRVTAYCQIFEFLHLFSWHIKTGRFFSRLVQNASDGFLSDLWISAPFQWGHKNRQIF